MKNVKVKKIKDIVLFLIIILFCLSFIACSSEQLLQQQQPIPLVPLDESKKPVTEAAAEAEEDSEKSLITIYNDSIVFATSRNEIGWNINTIVEHASVPDIIQLDSDLGDFKKGTLLSYFVDAIDSIDSDVEKIGFVYSTDNGKTWSERITVTIDGAENHMPVDPSIVQLDDGTMRLYYYDITAFRKHADAYSIYVAESSDGISFTLQQAAYTSDSVLTDPDVIYFKNKWLMYVKQEGFLILESDDGLTFTDAGFSSMAGIPGAVVVDDTVHLYGCGDGGVTRAISSDGITFDEEELTIRERVCDPSPTLLDDGTYVVVLKMFPK